MGMVWICDRCGVQKEPPRKDFHPTAWAEHDGILMCDTCDADYHEFLRGRPLQPVPEKPPVTDH